MDIMELDTLVKNIDRRLSRIEQILPTLATKEELREESAKTRQQFNAVAERIESYVRVVAEGHAGLQQRLDETNRRFEQEMARIDRRVLRLESH